MNNTNNFSQINSDQENSLCSLADEDKINIMKEPDNIIKIDVEVTQDTLNSIKNMIDDGNIEDVMNMLVPYINMNESGTISNVLNPDSNVFKTVSKESMMRSRLKNIIKKKNT